MFVDTTAVDKKWEQAVNLYREGKLHGLFTLRRPALELEPKISQIEI